jgi:hypothetical protein
LCPGGKKYSDAGPRTRHEKTHVGKRGVGDESNDAAMQRRRRFVGDGELGVDVTGRRFVAEKNTATQNQNSDAFY